MSTISLATIANNTLNLSAPANEQVLFMHGVEVRKLSDTDLTMLAKLVQGELKVLTDDALSGSERMKGMIVDLQARMESLVTVMDNEERVTYQDASNNKTTTTIGGNVLDWSKPLTEVVDLMFGLEVRNIADSTLVELAASCASEIKALEEGDMKTSKRVKAMIKALKANQKAFIAAFDNESRIAYQA